MARNLKSFDNLAAAIEALDELTAERGQGQGDARANH
jgi:hypothetical protein